ncbi:hypothetical protein GGR54DRAFT_650755 [Hypoxylon sp. NC1633]|nr:hypothetical protein GGR54DRAFT_650755 [Hypoxylon sp. NC1633]
MATPMNTNGNVNTDRNCARIVGGFGSAFARNLGWQIRGDEEKFSAISSILYHMFMLRQYLQVLLVRGSDSTSRYEELFQEAWDNVGEDEDRMWTRTRFWMSIPRTVEVGWASMARFWEEHLSYYYDFLSETSYTFEQAVYYTRGFFHTEENRQLYFQELRTTTIHTVVRNNPDKDLPTCLRLLISQVQHIHKGLSINYKYEINLRG